MDPMEKESQFQDGGLTIFDIDETLFHTTAKIAVVRNDKVVKELSNQEYNNYKLMPGEKFEYSQFADSNKFFNESVPIRRMMAKARAITQNAINTGKSRVVIITARNNFKDKQLFLETFRKHNFPIDKVRVERAGRIEGEFIPAFKKVIIIRNYLKTKQFSRVRLFDDSMSNLTEFLKLGKEFPQVTFEAFMANEDGSITTVK
jgi:Cu2+-containing amine oxidase